MKRYIVIIILVLMILAAFVVIIGAIPSIRMSVQRASTVNHAFSIADAAHIFYLEYGRFPALPEAAFYSALLGGNPRGIIFLIPPKSRSLASGVPTDAWGNPYKITFSGKRITITSPGIDGAFGNADDVSITK